MTTQTEAISLEQAAKLALDYMKSIGPTDMYAEEWTIVGRLEAALAEQPRGEATLAQQSAERGEPCGWQFYQDGKWHNGMETNNHRANTEAAGVPVRDVYPAPQQAPDYAWPTVEDYEKEVGFEVNDAFRSAWAMARTTNDLFKQIGSDT